MRSVASRRADGKSFTGRPRALGDCSFSSACRSRSSRMRSVSARLREPAKKTRAMNGSLAFSSSRGRQPTTQFAAPFRREGVDFAIGFASSGASSWSESYLGPSLGRLSIRRLPEKILVACTQILLGAAPRQTPPVATADETPAALLVLRIAFLRTVRQTELRRAVRQAGVRRTI